MDNNTAQSPIPQNPQFSLQSKVSYWIFRIKTFFHNSRVGKMVVVLLVLLILFFFSSALVLTYTSAKVPFISAQSRRNIVVGMYYVPFFPKTAEQILLVAVEKNTEISTYNPDFSFSAKLGAAQVPVFSADIHVSGPVDFTKDKKTSVDLAGEAAVNFGGEDYQIGGKIRKIEDDIYFKVDKIPEAFFGYYSLYSGYSYGYGYGGYDSPDQAALDAETAEIASNVNKALENWIIYEASEFKSEARDKVERGSGESLIDGVREETQDFLLKSNTLPQVKKLADENIEGADSYHLQLKPNKELIKKIFVDYIISNKSFEKTYYADPTEDLSKLSDAIDSVEIDAYFGKKDLILRKVSLKSVIKFGSLLDQSMGSYGTSPVPLLGILGTDNLVNANLTIATVLSAKDINKPVKVDVPSPVKTYKEFGKLMEEAFVTKKQKARELEFSKHENAFVKLRYYMNIYYIENDRYPEALSGIARYIPSGDSLAVELSKYQYKISPNGRDFIVYVLLDDAVVSEYTTPYYGFSSTYTTPRQLDKYDFDYVTGNPYSYP
jgi:hypothetical protein